MERSPKHTFQRERAAPLFEAPNSSSEKRPIELSQDPGAETKMVNLEGSGS